MKLKHHQPDPGDGPGNRLFVTDSVRFPGAAVGSYLTFCLPSRTQPNPAQVTLLVAYPGSGHLVVCGSVYHLCL